MLQGQRQERTVHYPTLKTVLAIEETLKKSSTPMSRNQILARLPTKVMRSTLNLTLNYLQKRGMILETKDGFIWAFNPSKKTGKASREGSELVDIKKTASAVLKRHDVKRAAIFGSTARGEAKSDSDIDILVEFKGRKTLLDLGRLYNDLEEKLKRKVDIVTYRTVDPRLRKDIFAEKVDIL